MKTLILMRHAKSSWEYNVSDRERPLKKRGFNDAKLVSEAFKKENITIDYVFSSPAKRAFTTCAIFMNQLNITEQKLQVSEALYDFGAESVVSFIKTIDNSFSTVLFFGHNYAFTSIVNLFGDKYIDNLPTSGLVAINFEVDSWEYVKHGQTIKVIFPRDFKH